MTNVRKAISTKTTEAFVAATLAAAEWKGKFKKVLKSNEGSEFGAVGLLVVIGVILAAVFIAFAIPYFKDDIGGGLKDKTAEFFNMK